MDAPFVLGPPLIPLNLTATYAIYRLVSKKPTTTNYIHKWQHSCTHYGGLADFADPYTLIEVDGVPVSRVFIQREALPTPSGPGSQAFSVGREIDQGFCRFCQFHHWGYLSSFNMVIGRFRGLHN